MNTWTPERGVLLYRPRLGGGTRPLQLHEPAFPWLAVPILGLGFTLFFAGLALLAVDGGAFQVALTAVGVALFAAAFGMLLRRFL